MALRLRIWTDEISTYTKGVTIWTEKGEETINGLNNISSKLLIFLLAMEAIHLIQSLLLNNKLSTTSLELCAEEFITAN